MAGVEVGIEVGRGGLGRWRRDDDVVGGDVGRQAAGKGGGGGEVGLVEIVQDNLVVGHDRGRGGRRGEG